jgi:hypothetical protein
VQEKNPSLPRFSPHFLGAGHSSLRKLTENPQVMLVDTVIMEKH